MKKLNLEDISLYVRNNIGEFHQKRLASVETIKLKDILKSKNPYLFKAKNVTSANEIVSGILNAYLSSSEEGTFGNWLERLAIFINEYVFIGRKAGIDGIDLDFDKDGKRYLVSIKSGPNWGNSSQVKKMVDQFNSARKRLATSGSKVEVVCVNGCCYGKSYERSEYKAKGNYYKICGKRFWELISDEPQLFVQLVEPLGYEAELRNKLFKDSYDKLKNRLEKEFLIDFCFEDGGINWEKLVRFNSEAVPKEYKKETEAKKKTKIKKTSN